MHRYKILCVTQARACYYCWIYLYITQYRNWTHNRRLVIVVIRGSLNSQKAQSRTLFTYHHPAQTSLAFLLNSHFQSAGYIVSRQPQRLSSPPTLQLSVFFIGLELCTCLVSLVRIRDCEFLKRVRAAIFAFACQAHTSTFSRSKSISLLQLCFQWVLS